MSEFAYINWLRRLTPADPRVLLGPGDDTAALRLTPGAPCLVTTDMLLEGSCFLLAEAGPRQVGVTLKQGPEEAEGDRASGEYTRPCSVDGSFKRLR